MYIWQNKNSAVVIFQEKVNKWSAVLIVYGGAHVVCCVRNVLAMQKRATCVGATTQNNIETRVTRSHVQS